MTVSEFLIEAVKNNNVGHVFGVPGDYALTLFKDFEKSDLQLINTADEQGAGFAADAYARLNGLGVLAVTYCVGGLKVANTTAQAYAEKSPVLVISGAPGTDERQETPLLHHKVKDFQSQQTVFREITVDMAVIESVETAAADIRRVINSAKEFKRPVYIEIPRNMVHAEIPENSIVMSPEKSVETDENILKEFIRESTELINKSEKPVILSGVEIHRFGMQEKLLKFIEKTGIPLVSTILSKSVINETHPLNLGVYEGAMGRKSVKNYFEKCDCIISLGVFMSDLNLGINTAHIDQSKVISLTSEKASIKYHVFEKINFEIGMESLLNADIEKRDSLSLPKKKNLNIYPESSDKKITVKYLFDKLNSFLKDEIVVIADPGDALFGAVDMTIHGEAEFLSPAYYASLGFAVPASLGVQLLKPQLRPLVLVGDGSFQMTGMELSTIVRYKLNPIILILNNSGYSTERPMLDGTFNDVLNWNYSRIPEILGAGKGMIVETENDLENALSTAWDCDEFSIIDVHLESDDCSDALKRLTEALKKSV